MGAGFQIKAKANQEADIYIYEDVGDSWFGGVTAKQFADDLKAVGAVTKINLRINSYGGDVFDGLAIYRLLAEHTATVISHIDGVAASIASVIAMAGSEIRIGEAAQIMIHEAWGVAMGNAEDLRRTADRLETINGSISDIYVARTGNTTSKVRDWMTAETWLVGREAVDNGFADSVVENIKIAARLDPAKHRFKRVPSALTERPNIAELNQRLASMRAKLARHRAG